MIAMLRRMFTLAAMVSLLICVATAALWVRSYFRKDYVHLFGTRGGVTSVQGQIWIWYDPAFVSYNDQPRNFYHYSADPIPIHLSGPSAFGFAVRARLSDNVTQLVAFPHWSLVLISAIAPVVWFRTRPSRVRPGMCARCGYDLRATPTRCPECGFIPADAESVSG